MPGCGADLIVDLSIVVALAAQHIAAQPAGGGLWEMLSVWLVAALALYGASTLLWVWVLVHVPISRAYPFVLLATPVVPVAGYWLFSEPLSLRYAAGFGLMLAGLALIQKA